MPIQLSDLQSKRNDPRHDAFTRVVGFLEIGLGLAIFGVGFLFLGMVFLFDKGLLAVGNVTFTAATSA